LNLKQNIGNDYFFNHLVGQKISISIVASYGGPKIKVSLQIFDLKNDHLLILDFSKVQI
jgi:hypothetical protein